MAHHAQGDVTLEEACARNGLTLIAQVTADIGTTTQPPAPATVDVVTSPYGPAFIVGHSGAFVLLTADEVLLTADEALDVADALFDAAMAARQMAADPDVRAVEHARRMVEDLGLTWPTPERKDT